jgi:uncharacterized protein (DUF2252 family)
VTRLLTSIMLAGESLGFKRKQLIQCCKDMLEAYSHTLSSGKAMYIEEETASGIIRSFLKKVASRHHKDLLKERTEVKGGQLKLKIDNKRIFKLKKEEKKDLVTFLQKWIDEGHDRRMHHTVTDVAIRVAGTGSIGIERYAVLIHGKFHEDKYMALDMKEAIHSSIEPYQSYTQPSWQSQAHRVVSVQYWMQNVSPALLFPLQYKNKWYVVRELQPIADKINFDEMNDDFDDFKSIIISMGRLVASAQLRSTGRKGSCTADALMDMATQGGWQQILLDYAEVYCRKVQTDFEEFKTAHNKGYFGK